MAESLGSGCEGCGGELGATRLDTLAWPTIWIINEVVRHTSPTQAAVPLCSLPTHWAPVFVFGYSDVSVCEQVAWCVVACRSVW